MCVCVLVMCEKASMSVNTNDSMRMKAWFCNTYVVPREADTPFAAITSSTRSSTEGGLASSAVGVKKSVTIEQREILEPMAISACKGVRRG